MYRQFATFYDHVVLIDYTSIVMDFIRDNRIPVRDVLDLGCGTGTFLLRLAEQGIAGAGIDISEQMIAASRAKAERRKSGADLQFHVANIADFHLDRTFDLVTCNLDTLNHLLSEDEVRQTFLNALRHLNDGGVFCFDIHTTAGLRNWAYQNNIHDENLVRFWHGTFNEQTGIGTLYIEAFLRVHPLKSLYTRHRETVHERAYPLALIQAWLQKAGFKEARPIGPNAELSVEEMENQDRCFFCAEK